MSFSRVNVGCGVTPTPGWHNYDNSYSVRLARWPALVMLANRLSVLSDEQKAFIAFAAQSDIKWADASKRIPELDGTVDALYSSHMLEHLRDSAVHNFLTEALRVLRPGGVIRIAVPNVRYHIDQYLQHGDADRFMAALRVTSVHRRGTPSTLRRMALWFAGDRHHQWMYDGASLCKLLERYGFQNARIMNPGSTTIEDSGGLDLEEQAPLSVFVEANRPTPSSDTPSA